MIALLALAGCGGGGGDGGRDTLPGPVPAGVTFTDIRGPAAPPFTLALLDGTRVSGAELWKTRPVVVFFFASWCSRCATQQKALASLAHRWGGAVAFVGIAARDQPGALKPWLSDHDVGYPVGIDSGLAISKRYAIRTPPAVILIGRGGALLRGWPDGVGEDELNRQLQQIVRR